MERLKQLHGYVLVPFAIATLFTGCKEESLNDAGPRDGGLRELGHHEDGGGMNVAPLTPTLVWNGPSRMTSLGADTDHIVWVEPKSSETDEYGDPLVAERLMALEIGSSDPYVVATLDNDAHNYLLGVSQRWAVLEVAPGKLLVFDVTVVGGAPTDPFPLLPEAHHPHLSNGTLYAVQRDEAPSAWTLLSVRLTPEMGAPTSLPLALDSPTVFGMGAAGGFVAVLGAGTFLDEYLVTIFDENTGEVVATDRQSESTNLQLSSVQPDATIFYRHVIPHDGTTPYQHNSASTCAFNTDTLRRGWCYAAIGRALLRTPTRHYRDNQLIANEVQGDSFVVDMLDDGVLWVTRTELGGGAPGQGWFRFYVMSEPPPEPCRELHHCDGTGGVCTDGLCTPQ